MLYPNQTTKDNCFYLGGVNTVELAKKYNTPLYVMDEDMIRETCREYRDTMKDALGDNALVLYASKAFSSLAMYRLIKEEGLGIDVVSGGELYTAIKADFPPEKIYFHGNNKTVQEMEMALEYGVSRFVVDNVSELYLLDETAKRLGKRAAISFRIKPGIDAHTFDAVMTGQIADLGRVNLMGRGGGSSAEQSVGERAGEEIDILLHHVLSVSQVVGQIKGGRMGKGAVAALSGRKAVDDAGYG